jgi:hypothetical protein
MRRRLAVLLLALATALPATARAEDPTGQCTGLRESPYRNMETDWACDAVDGDLMISPVTPCAMTITPLPGHRALYTAHGGLARSRWAQRIRTECWTNNNNPAYDVTIGRTVDGHWGSVDGAPPVVAPLYPESYVCTVWLVQLAEGNPWNLRTDAFVYAGRACGFQACYPSVSCLGVDCEEACEPPCEPVKDCLWALPPARRGG